MEKGRQHKEKNRHGAASGPQQAGEEIDEIFDFLLVALLVVSVTPFAARPPLSAAVQNLRRHEQAEVEVLADILKSERPSIFTLRSDYRAVLFENLCRVLGAQVVAWGSVKLELRAGPARLNEPLQLVAQELPWLHYVILRYQLGEYIPDALRHCVDPRLGELVFQYLRRCLLERHAARHPSTMRRLLLSLLLLLLLLSLLLLPLLLLLILLKQQLLRLWHRLAMLKSQCPGIPII
jgi:hypothetical protein